MDEDFDCVYDGLDEPLIAVNNEKLKDDNYELSKKIHDLEQALHTADNEIIALKDKNNILATNISELFNTAKREIERKDRMIMELRKQVENLPFRSQGARNDRRFNNQLHENSDFSKKNEIDRIKRFNDNSKKTLLDYKKTDGEKQNLKRSMNRSPHRSRTNRRHSPTRERRRYDRSQSPKRRKSNTPTRSRHSKHLDYSNRDRNSSTSRQDDRRKSRDNNRINSSHMSILDSVNEDAKFEDYGSPVDDGRNDNFGTSFLRAKSKEIKIIDSNTISKSNIDYVNKNRKKIDLKDYLCRKNTDNNKITEKIKKDVKESQDVNNKNCSEKSRETKNKVVEIVEIILQQSDIKKDLELKDTKADVESEIDKDYDHTMEVCEVGEDMKNDSNEESNISEENNKSISNINDSSEKIIEPHMDIISDKTSEISGEERKDVTIGDYHITMDSNQETENMPIEDEDNVEHENNKMHLFNGKKSIQCKVETNLEIENHDQQRDTENHARSKEGIDELELVYKMGNEPEKTIQCEFPRYEAKNALNRRFMRIKMENNITFVGENSEIKSVPPNTDNNSTEQAIVESDVSSKSNDPSLLVELKTEDMETDEQRKTMLESEMKENEQEENTKHMETSKENVEIKSENANEISTSDNLISNISMQEPVEVKEEIKTENKNSVIIISTSKVVRSRRRYIFRKNT